MGKPIFVLAGQSNAGNIADEMRAALSEKFGADGFVLVRALFAGAPLTFKRSDQDWVVSDELRKDLIDNTVAALNDNPSSEIAGIFWLQGEADTSDIARAAEYDDRFNALMNEYRLAVDQATGSRETGIESAKVAISQLSENAPKSGSRSQWDDIIEEQISAAQGSVLTDIVNPDAIAALYGFTQHTMFKDSLHYSDAFNQYLAQALIDAVDEGGGQPGKRMVYGTVGNDTLAGGSGANIMLGGFGDDVYHANDNGDQIVEYHGQGNDHVFAATNFSLRFHSQYIEALTLTGTGNIDGTGNSLANIIKGNGGDNFLDGAWGNDALYGHKGNDTFRDSAGANHMYGGKGNDTYIINSSNNKIVEFTWGGIDSVIASIDFSLFASGKYLENLTLSGTRDIHGLGNAKNNRITGNDGDNYLNGGRGNDVLTGGGGLDTLQGGIGADTFRFNKGDLTDYNGKNHTELDTILDFKVGKDLIQFDSGIAQSLSDLRMWVDADNNQLVIKVIGTDQRLLLQGDYLVSEIYDPGNFLFS